MKTQVSKKRTRAKVLIDAYHSVTLIQLFRPVERGFLSTHVVACTEGQISLGLESLITFKALTYILYYNLNGKTISFLSILPLKFAIVEVRLRISFITIMIMVLPPKDQEQLL